MLFCSTVLPHCVWLLILEQLDLYVCHFDNLIAEYTTIGTQYTWQYVLLISRKTKPLFLYLIKILE